VSLLLDGRTRPKLPFAGLDVRAGSSHRWGTIVDVAGRLADVRSSSRRVVCRRTNVDRNGIGYRTSRANPPVGSACYGTNQCVQQVGGVVHNDDAVANHSSRSRIDWIDGRPRWHPNTNLDNKTIM
jgi:hypothetical protein